MRRELAEGAVIVQVLELVPNLRIVSSHEKVALTSRLSGATSKPKWWRQLTGIKKVSLIHTYDHTIADGDAFVARLKAATAVWIEGGDDAPLYDAYVGTPTEEEVRKVFVGGGVVGGTSVGATLLGTSTYDIEPN